MQRLFWLKASNLNLICQLYNKVNKKINNFIFHIRARFRSYFCGEQQPNLQVLLQFLSFEWGSLYWIVTCPSIRLITIPVVVKLYLFIDLIVFSIVQIQWVGILGMRSGHCKTFSNQFQHVSFITGSRMILSILYKTEFDLVFQE